MYFDLHVKVGLFLSGFNKFWTFRQICEKYANFKLN